MQYLEEVCRGVLMADAMGLLGGLILGPPRLQKTEKVGWSLASSGACWLRGLVCRGAHRLLGPADSSPL